MKKLLFILTLAGAAMATNSACTGNKTNSDNDSLAARDTVLKPLELLPDTMLESATEVDYSVEIVDSVTPGDLKLMVESAYDTVSGVYTFRGNTRRDMAMAGKIKGTPHRIEQSWAFKTARDSTHTAAGNWGGGSGWTGQPLYVEWTPEQINAFKQTSPGLTPQFKSKEIIVGSLCGKVYFIDYESGQMSRQPINVGNPIKGTISLDPAMNGSLYVGQGIPETNPFGHMAIDLASHKVNYFWPLDHKALRGWGAYDSSPVVVGDFLFWPSENGTLYKYTRQGNGMLTMHSCMRYRVNGKGSLAAGMESSMCAYRNYGYIADNYGDILCVNLCTMKPVWRYNVGDDIDASIVMEIENGVPYIYAGCEVDLQGMKGNSELVKLNGLTGVAVWQKSYECSKVDINGNHFDGGLYSTPLLGHGNCEGMLFLNLCQPDNTRAADFMAIDRKTGETIYAVRLKAWAWSSPVPFYNEKNELFVMTGDSEGFGYLFNAKTGELLFNEHIASIFESSPVVKDNYAVVGSRGDMIYRFVIK